MPVVRAVGAFDGGIGAITPVIPTHATNDILLLPVETNDQAVTVSGWTAVLNSPQSNATTVTRMSLFWLRATSSAMTNPTTSDSGDHQMCAVFSIAGCVTTGDPWDVGSGGSTTSVSSQTMTGATTTVDNCLIFIALSSSRDLGASNTQFSAWANADLTNITEHMDETKANAAGGGFGIATGEKTVAGAFGNTTVTVADALGGAYIILALKPVIVPPYYPRQQAGLAYLRV